MRRIAAGIIVLAMLPFIACPTQAFADLDLPGPPPPPPPDGGSESPAPASASASGGGIPSLLTMPWGLTGGETPTITPGTAVEDEYGVPLSCPAWFPPTGCYDNTRTEYYRNNMRILARQLLASGAMDFGIYTGWVNSIKE